MQHHGENYRELWFILFFKTVFITDDMIWNFPCISKSGQLGQRQGLRGTGGFICLNYPRIIQNVYIMILHSLHWVVKCHSQLLLTIENQRKTMAGQLYLLLRLQEYYNLHHQSVQNSIMCLMFTLLMRHLSCPALLAVLTNLHYCPMFGYPPPPPAFNPWFPPSSIPIPHLKSHPPIFMYDIHIYLITW